MIDLPTHRNLPINYLSACFDNVTTSYKFYWFLAILDHIRYKQTRIISGKELLTRMIASVVYPTNYYRLSFGKQDRLTLLANKITEKNQNLSITKPSEIHKMIEERILIHSSISHEIGTLLAYVPYRFLRPFFAKELKGIKDVSVNGMIKKYADESFESTSGSSIYRFLPEQDGDIELQIEWFDYLNEHFTILRGFCHWHLLQYIQKNNPNVPNISNKLFPPEKRDMRLAREFWKLAFNAFGTIKCIYSHQYMNSDTFSLDHFLPWRFVTHDLLWNLVPAPGSVNSAKSDSLPSLENYLDPFLEMQYNAMKAIVSSRRVKMLEDYLFLFKVGSYDDLQSLTLSQFRNTLADTIIPQFQIARNMGFETDWKYD
ncbi:MAG: hypothetical protein O9264_11925 [Leptospira sp.]|nr:hypothetical protein [Leptospira sp.]